MNIAVTIANTLKVSESQVQAAITLLDDGATVPFISRYRKEATNGLDDTQLRGLETQLIYLRELDERRSTILKTITELGKLTPELKAKIENTKDKATLEDYYLPYKPKRRTKASVAREAGLQPLATLLITQSAEPQTVAVEYINSEKDINDVGAALEGAKQIVMEQLSEDADLLAEFREKVWQQAVLSTTVVPDKKQQAAKFSDYFEYSEPMANIPSHRALAIFRARREGFLRAQVSITDDQHDFYKTKIARHFNLGPLLSDAQGEWLKDVVQATWKIKILLKLELDLFARLREVAEQEAILVFARNLKNLLLGAPAGMRVTMGLDPGLRTGTKVVVVDKTGKLLAYSTIFPLPPKRNVEGAMGELQKLCKKYNVEIISIGNGTASRETDAFVAEFLRQNPEFDIQKIMVSEAGASVYSASERAAKEFPKLDVTYRGAVSIARRLQDPLAELVKVEPKAIGVGQYQHDVNQTRLGQSLFGVMQDCVNAVGVDINTASSALLAGVAGLNQSLADNIVAYRDEHGAFKKRQDILSVPRLGPKTFEQAAGFLRINNGENPLDASAVHPEAYPVIQHILDKLAKPLASVMGNTQVLRDINPIDYTSEQFGLPTVQDIIKELEKPGRDPRPEFKMPKFLEGVTSLKDVEQGMECEGVVSNVANFGAFVDIGVHQDGLVHKSELADKFVNDPNEIVKVGDIVKVRVIAVDAERKRINLSMRSPNAERPAKSATRPKKLQNKPQPSVTSSKPTASPMPSMFADKLKAAFNSKD